MSVVAPGARRRGASSIFDAGQPRLNVVTAGNSIWDNFYTSIGTFDNHLMMFEPLKSSPGVTHYSASINGGTWRAYINNATSLVDSRWDASATNVLVMNETVNSLWFGGQSAAQVKSDITEYIGGRLALHPWRIIFSTCPPAAGSGNDVALNDARMEVNAWATANAVALGIERVVDSTRVPAFNHDGKSSAPFQAYADQWRDHWLHPNDPPKVAWAELIVSAMRTMRPNPA